MTMNNDTHFDTIEKHDLRDKLPLEELVRIAGAMAEHVPPMTRDILVNQFNSTIQRLRAREAVRRD